MYDRTNHESNEGLIGEVAMSAMTEIALTCDSEIGSGHPQSRRPDAAEPPLRLTRRGRIVVAVAAVLLVAVISLLAAGVAQATSHGAAPRAARQNLVQVVVRPGQTLWSVAESADPEQDTRVVVQQIIDLNSLNSTTVPAGRQLWVPRG
ncbi:MAG TPA: LysM peptidoglycan-binding domain-containing protein [Streptosporangiaceae bacterium]